VPAVTETGPTDPTPAAGAGGGRPGGISRRPLESWRRWRRAGLAYRAAWLCALVVVALLALMVVRLPWVGDLGIHAATLQRLRHSLTSPGDPLVDSDVPSPYYSPWMLLLAVAGRIGGLSVFATLHLAAAVDLVLLVTGVRRFVRTLTTRPAAVPLALLTVTLLYGWQLFTWSGFPGMTSLALCLAYPSTFAMGAAFHLWALARQALARDWGLPGWLGLGLGLALILLSHQFTGVVTVFGLIGVVAGARPWPPRAVWLRIAAGVALCAVILLVWPYYSFFGLLGVGGLDAVHKPLYAHLVGRFGLLVLGVAALALRLRRDRRDPLVIMFALGAVVYAAGGISGHYALGRVLPALFFPAQIALAVEAADGREKLVRTVLAPLAAVGLLVGCWAQAGTLSYVLRPAAIPPVLRDAPTQHAWSTYSWVRPYVRYGDVVMTADFRALRQTPAYGGYTVEPGWPDFFLPDQAARIADTKRYFAAGTSRAQRLALLREYHVRWVIETRGRAGGPATNDPALRETAHGPHGEVLLRVVAKGG
jgi:hypothetical protein